ncbi:MAG: hypothetical protein HYX67_10400, partial [Candidatus Melainabacteria bacterium]|nr:hypothetical protein [Candidatus Melainabacteria bacterium]
MSVSRRSRLVYRFVVACASGALLCASAMAAPIADSTFIHEMVPKNAAQLKAKITELDGIILQSPKVAKNYALRGANYNILGEHGLALLDYNHAIKLEPKKQQWYEERSHVYFRLLRTNDAVKDLTKALELGPGSAKIYLARARGYELLHDYAK